ncbi:putative cathepsin E [Roridomyces roridus]|uniref:Cathepsin E n=1 Tax=Roridomyces roridus TaxID=1738132 RepID=A0AAD7FSW6_9AGAR|nr:putative cathepsin E [Roridomyces roridus]
MVRIGISSAWVATTIGLVTASVVSLDQRAPLTITVPLKKISTITNTSHLVANDYARLQHHHSKHSGNATTRVALGEASATNELNAYIAQTKVGSQTFDLVVDTGSSNTWVGSDTKFIAGSTGNNTGNAVEVDYGSGGFIGDEYTDAVSIGGTGVKQQSIGVAQLAIGFDGVDGILGLGPVELTQGTVQGVSEVPTFMQTLVSEGVIAQNILGISFAPIQGSAPESTNGVLTFGGVDSKLFKGNITYTPRIPPFWGISASSFKFGANSLGPNSTAAYLGFVDTGTTLILLPGPVFTAFLTVSNASVDPSTGFVAFPANAKPTQDISFVMGGTMFTMTPEQYLLPQAQYAFWGISAQQAQASGGYALFGNAETAGAPAGFVLGMSFLEFFYSVYDAENDRVGLAPAA